MGVGVHGTDSLTLREALAIRMPRVGFVLLVALVAAIAFLLGLLEHHNCTTAPSEVPRPEPGTPRYVWCAHHDYLYPWVLTLVPPALVALLGLLARRRAVPVLVCTIVVVAAALWVGNYPSKLDYAPLLTSVRR